MSITRDAVVICKIPLDFSMRTSEMDVSTSKSATSMSLRRNVRGLTPQHAADLAYVLCALCAVPVYTHKLPLLSCACVSVRRLIDLLHGGFGLCTGIVKWWQVFVIIGISLIVIIDGETKFDKPVDATCECGWLVQ